MKTIELLYKQATVLFITFLVLLSCSEEDESFPLAASLTVVHGVPDAPAVHVNYFGRELEVLNFSINSTLGFRSGERFTIPANETRDVRFTYASDTTTEVLNRPVTLNVGQISTLFLLGDSANLSSVIIEDTGLQIFQDSLNGIRFINFSEDIGAVNVGLVDSSIAIGSGLSFSDATEFIEFDATLENSEYNFTFKNDADSVLASFRFQQYQIFDFPGFFFVNTLALRRNVTLALVGNADDGEGNSTLSVVRVNHFDQ